MGTSPTCLSDPPPPTLCEGPSSHCLTTREYQARDPAEIEELGDPDQPLKLVRVERRCVEEGYELYKRGYGGGQGAAVEGKWKEGHVPDTSLVMQLSAHTGAGWRLLQLG